VRIDELSGRELEALVAQRLFGHEVEERAGRTSGTRDYSYLAGPDHWTPVPGYAANLSAHLLVATWLTEHGWSTLIADRKADRWQVVLPKVGTGDVEAVGDHQYEAFARAAVRAGRAAPSGATRPSAR
jgi:hypothetical protein